LLALAGMALTSTSADAGAWCATYRLGSNLMPAELTNFLQKAVANEMKSQSNHDPQCDNPNEKPNLLPK
jgi:hypothetical protein